MPRIHPLNPSAVGGGHVHSPGAGHARGPHGPQGPGPTHPKTLERIGPLAALAGRRTPAPDGDARPRADLPSRGDGGGRSWLSSMKQAANKTGHAISHGFQWAGHAMHKFGQSLNEPPREPAWLRNMSEDERAHYDYYGELPPESSHTASLPVRTYIQPPWERLSAPVEVRHRPMNAREQAAENERASYYNERPRTSVEERVSWPSSAPASPGSSPTRVRERAMNPAEQAAENARAAYHHEVPRTTVEEFVAARPARSRAATTDRDALQANVRETIPRMALSRLHHAEPREFVQLAQILTRGTRYEAAMAERARHDPALGAAMKERWQALQQHLDGLRAQGRENVPNVAWLFENRSARLMAFLVDGNGGSKLVRPTRTD